MLIRIALVVLVAVFVSGISFAMCGSCGSDHKGGMEHKGAFSNAADEAVLKDGVKEITYKQFMDIRDSGEKYVLLDVLSKESYAKGHISGAKSFPLDTINKTSADKILSKGDHIIVYCGSFQCTASTEGAKKLSALGYDVLDYKGGLKEWQEKGNKLVSE